MSFLGRITNSLPFNVGIVNSTQPVKQDKGVGGFGTTMTTGVAQHKLHNLTDLQIVNPTISNARRAVEIDATVWSSLMSLIIMATRERIEIKGDPDTDDESGANPKAVAHIKKKVRDWNLDNLRVTTGWKNLVDGRGFIETYVDGVKPTIQEVNHLAYDEYDYDFIDVVDPYTNQLLGYKQKATIYPIPSNWEAMTFDQIKTRPKKTEEKTFTRNKGYLPVFMPKFFIGDGNSEGLVFKVLDDVYFLKTLKNIMPNAAKMATTTLGVKVGNKDFPFKPYNPGDTTDTKIRKSELRMQSIGEMFSKKYAKELVLYDQTIDANMIGDGKLPDFPSYNNWFKQEIRERLLTPDSRFSSQSSNRAVSQEQMSGSMGQTTVIDYISNNIHSQYEKYIFDLELTLNGFEEDVGKIHIGTPEHETEDELTLSTIAKDILTIRPDLFDIVVDKYLPRLASVYDAKNMKPENPVMEGPVVNSLSGAYYEQSFIPGIVNYSRKLLEENGILI